MADDSKGTEAKIEAEDRALRQRENIRDPEAKDRDKFEDAESGFPGGHSTDAVGASGVESEYGARPSDEERSEEEERSS